MLQSKYRSAVLTGNPQAALHAVHGGEPPPVAEVVALAPWQEPVAKPATAATLVGQLEARAAELRIDIARLEASKTELAMLEKMIAVSKEAT